MASEPEQLSLTGSPVPWKDAGKSPRLTDNQRLAVQTIGTFGSVTSAHLSALIHDGERCCDEDTTLPQDRRAPCCDEGRDLAYNALKQLTKRGVTERIGRNRWRLTNRD